MLGDCSFLALKKLFQDIKSTDLFSKHRSHEANGVQNEEKTSEISLPYNVHHKLEIKYDRATGKYTGVPTAWLDSLEKDLRSIFCVKFLFLKCQFENC